MFRYPGIKEDYVISMATVWKIIYMYGWCVRLGMCPVRGNIMPVYIYMSQSFEIEPLKFLVKPFHPWFILQIIFSVSPSVEIDVLLFNEHIFVGSGFSHL